MMVVSSKHAHQLAVVADIELKKVRKIVKIRNKNANFLDKHLSTVKEVSLPERKKNYTETFALYMILVKDRDKLIRYLKRNKIETKIHYPVPLNKQKAAKNLNLNQNDFKVANMQSKQLLTLPIHQYMTKKQLIYIYQNIKKFYNK